MVVMEPQNNGHFGTKSFVHYKAVSLVGNAQSLIAHFFRSLAISNAVYIAVQSA